MPRRKKPARDPAPKKRPTKRTAKKTAESVQHEKKRTFLEAYGRLGNISRAAATGGDRSPNGIRLAADDPEYAAAFEDAEQVAGDTLEAEAWRRAVEGTEEPVFHRARFAATSGNTTPRF